jgi:hypothetical protein
MNTTKKTEAKKGQGKDKTETPLIWLKLVEKRIKAVSTIGAVRHFNGQKTVAAKQNLCLQTTTDK